MESTPKIIFIVPYRDRDQQQQFFANQMKNTVLKDVPLSDYKIWYIHQCDNRSFNRGALKNIGFLVVKQRYPHTYRNITLVFNDIDTMPYTSGFLPYETIEGVVKHFYGYEFALGGIVSMRCGDFERINGFPNFWAWGFEDNLLNQRVLKTVGLRIDRSRFYPIMDKNILQLKDGLERLVNKKEFDRYIERTTEGVNSIQGLEYTVEEESGFINVSRFSTGVEENKQFSKMHDLRKGAKPFTIDKLKRGGVASMKMVL